MAPIELLQEILYCDIILLGIIRRTFLKRFTKHRYAGFTVGRDLCVFASARVGSW